MSTLIVLGGPKAVGKSTIGRALWDALSVFHVDADPMILRLQAEGVIPHPEDGWLAWTEQAVMDALALHSRVSVEVTGEWESDYKLMRGMASRGHRVLALWLTAPEEETLQRLRARDSSDRVPVDDTSARATYRRGALRAAQEQWSLVLDLSGRPRSAEVVAAIERLLQSI